MWWEEAEREQPEACYNRESAEDLGWYSENFKLLALGRHQGQTQGVYWASRGLTIVVWVFFNFENVSRKHRYGPSAFFESMLLTFVS
jgi:hypothetical protein